MSDVAEQLDNLLDALDREGVGSVYVNITVEPSIRKINTGEYTDTYQPIRERVVSEEEMAEVATDTSWRYGRMIDSMGDAWVKDRFSLHEKLEERFCDDSN